MVGNDIKPPVSRYFHCFEFFLLFALFSSLYLRSGKFYLFIRYLCVYNIHTLYVYSLQCCIIVAYQHYNVNTFRIIGFVSLSSSFSWFLGINLLMCACAHFYCAHALVSFYFVILMRNKQGTMKQQTINA